MNPSAVTVSLIPEFRGGPFIFHESLPEACRHALALGYDAIEIFARSADALDVPALGKLLKEHDLKVSGMGTGAGAVVHKLTLTSPDANVRRDARNFIDSFIEVAGHFGAPAIVGSMQGWSTGGDRKSAQGYLAEALEEFGERAGRAGTVVMFEPINRYETNVVNTIRDAAGLIRTLHTRNVRILADTFHMNIEEQDIAGALNEGGALIGHVHVSDSNRRPPRQGHTDFRAVAAGLKAIGYKGYLSVEALPLPDSATAARQAIDGLRKYFGQPAGTQH